MPAEKNWVRKNEGFENCHIIFRNFEGREERYNNKGNRNFGVIIDDPKRAKAMLKEGWNVKELRPREEGGDPAYFLPVAVSFSNIRPKIMMITSSGKTLLDESTVNLLDGADILSCDLVVRPYNWEVNGKHGVKAYVKSMYVTVEEDQFASKYSGSVGDDFRSSEDDIPF